MIERLAKLKKGSMPKSLKMTMMKFGVMEFHFSERDAWSRKNNNDVRFAAHVIKMIYASNEPKSVLARDLGDCRDNLRNSRSVFLIV